MTVIPQGLAARFAWLLALALVAANMVALALLALQSDRFDARAAGDRELARIVGLVPVLEGTPTEGWRDILRRADTRGIDLSADRQPVVEQSGRDPVSRGVSGRLSDLLGGREVRAMLLPGARGQRGVVVSVALVAGDGPAWLNIRAHRTGAADGPAPGLAVGLILLSSLLAVLAVGLWFLRGLTRPLRELEAAARAAGAGDRTARVPVAGAREVRAVAAAFNDMQTRIGAFEAERLRMVGAVGHDLRTPITSLRIRAEMLDDDTQRDAMVRTLDEMAVMADGLVSYARSGTEAEMPGPVDLRPMLARLAAERGAVLLQGPEAQVRGRPVALGRAVGNLVDNALRYGGSARMSLDVAGHEAVIAVSDDGPGLPDDQMASVFDPFVRGEDSRNRDSGGAGLGLSIAKAIIQAHGGTVGLANGSPRGLVATIRLPLAPGVMLADTEGRH